MTHADADTADLQEALRELLSENFKRVRIVSVTAADGDFGDDNVLEITVLFEGSTEDLVAGQPPGLFGMVSNKIADFHQGDTPMPVLNFVSVDDIHA